MYVAVLPFCASVVGAADLAGSAPSGPASCCPTTTPQVVVTARKFALAEAMTVSSAQPAFPLASARIILSAAIVAHVRTVQAAGG